MQNKRNLIFVIVILVLIAIVIYFITQAETSEPIGASDIPAESGEGPDGLPTPQEEGPTDSYATDGIPAESGEGPDGLPTPAL